jgi:hypothetical protein
LLLGFNTTAVEIRKAQAVEGYGLQPVRKNTADEAAFTKHKEAEGAAAFRGCYETQAVVSDETDEIGRDRCFPFDVSIRLGAIA